MANPLIKIFNNANSGLNAATFVVLAIPIDCNIYLLKNNGADILYIRSDIADPLTEDTISPGSWESLTAFPPFWLNTKYARYKTGDQLYAVKGTGPLMGKFWI